MADPLDNPTLHPRALTERERAPGFKWHSYAGSPRSSQAFCLSAFGTLRSVSARDRVLEALFRHALPGFPPRRRPRRWSILPEAESPELLSELGAQQATSIDALCLSSDEVVCIESKFATDAEHGFGGCSQFPKACAGFRGPGSDIAKQTDAWCRLENWEGHRSPRAYWSLGKRWFRPEIFNRQTASDVCALRGANYQLMRNFLFAASIAERDKKSRFGVLAIGPRKYASVLAEQVAAFRRDILLPDFRDLIAFVDYEEYADILDAANATDAAELAEFLRERIRHVVGRGDAKRPAPASN
ncbi:hypothetical protein PEL8287_02950 [Roseovarius litorisediminis]|uniref:Uncharacterized protein n=1 Tax=Roseovarius litorisediminis TaxID=1312363 RepID=A0A1Y5T987_9RHOB|nr:hypothetical protein [Roseovarius litorisediminis]SLN55163.1 hypothetical protein PEL8287_02950 [Roseovarius litorisediminis]